MYLLYRGARKLEVLEKSDIKKDSGKAILAFGRALRNLG
jgi:hypothetical protein